MNIYEAFTKLKAEGGYVTRNGSVFYHSSAFDKRIRDCFTFGFDDIFATDWQHVTELPTTN